KDEALHRWIRLAGERVQFQGLPARICWLGMGERERFGEAIHRLVERGEVEAPIVIGRDHLDCGSVASPYRETEAMLDGSDAIADWPLLNALVNTASGASWVSIHHGGGVGIGRSIHAGQVVVVDGTELAGRKAERVPGPLLDVEGRAALPGFVDAHTHLVFAGDRTEEFDARVRGEPYEAGGIRATVDATRAATDEVLVDGARRLAREALRSGTTTLEVKSGYGLTVEDEARLLTIAGTVADEVTFLGAHVVPAEC